MVEIILRPNEILVSIFAGTTVATAGTATLGTEEPGRPGCRIVVLARTQSRAIQQYEEEEREPGESQAI
jgi:precorrin-4 methylase